MIELRTLGGAGLLRPDGVEVRSVLVQPKRFALLVYLALEAPGRFHRRDAILALLWPESGSERARSALRTSLHFLRRSIGEETIESRGADELGLAQGHVWCDAVAFQHALDAQHLEKALEVYGGPLLPGFSVEDAPAWNEWLDRERARLARRASDAAWGLTERLSAANDLTAAVAQGRRALEILPDEEVSVRRLMDLLDRSGDRAGALQLYGEFQRRMSIEYGVTPAPETAQLAEAIQRRADAGPVQEWRAPPVPAPAAKPPAPRDPAGPASIARTPSGPRRVLAGVLLAAVAAAGLISARSVVRPGAAGVGTGPGASERIAVLPFAMRGETQLAYLGEGMVDVLGAKLDGAGELRSADPRAVLAAASAIGQPLSPADGQTVAASLDARFYVLGGMVATADRLQITASLYDRSRPADPPVLGQVEGDAGDVFGLIDGLAAELLARRAVGPAQRLERIAARTTHSLPALKLYLQGTRALRRGEFDRAVELLESAVREDSTFALAAYQLSNAFDATGRNWPEEPPLDIARRHSGRLSEHDRRLIEARAAYYVGMDGADRSEALFRELVASYPTDVDAWYHLGDIVFHMSPARGQSFTRARAQMTRALEFDPGHLAALQHLARIEAWEGNRQALDSLTRRGLAIATEGDQLLEFLALRALALDDEGARRQVLDLLGQATDLRTEVTVVRAITYAIRLDDAEALLEPLRAQGRPPPAIARAHAIRATLALARGQPRAAMRELAIAERIHPGRADNEWMALRTFPMVTGTCPALVPLLEPPESLAPGLVRGLDAVCGGDFDTAFAEALPFDAAGHVYGNDLRVYVAWAGGPFAADSALSLLPVWTHPAFPRSHFRLVHADLLRRLGRIDEALRWLTAIPEDLDAGGIVYFAPAELRQAEILESLGRTAEAATHYSRFIEMWREAEPELRPLLHFAHERLRAIGGQRDSSR